MAHFFALLLTLMQAPDALPTTAFDARWVTAFTTAPAATPGYDDTTAYVPLRAGEKDGLPTMAQLVAVDLNRGVIRWRRDLETALTPATGEGLVFSVGKWTIEARDAQTGDIRWSAPLSGTPAAPLYYDTGWLLASTTAGELAAYRASDGTLVWRREFGAPLLGQPGPSLDRLFVPLSDNRLVALLLATGETVWERTLIAPITALLALNEQLVFGLATKDVVSIDTKRGRDRWVWRLGGDMAGVPIADDKRIYFASRDNMLRAVDRKSGNLRWKAGLASRPAGGPLRITEALAAKPVSERRPGETLKLNDALLMPLVSSEIIGFDAVSGKPMVTATAAGEIGAQPYVRPGVRQSWPQLITVSRDGQLQGFGRRFEPIPVVLASLPGSPALP